MLDWDTVALLDGILLDERRIGIRWRCWMGGKKLNERTLAVLSAGLKIRWRCWMGGRKLDEQTLVVLDERESAKLALLDGWETAE